jgi:DNA-directed RNA polymerase subunit RPC12/RpoP
MDIHFFCSHCGRNLVVDEAGAGREVECRNPNCRSRVRVPRLQEQPKKKLTLKREAPIAGSTPVPSRPGPALNSRGQLRTLDRSTATRDEY